VKGRPNRDGSVDLFHMPMKSDDGYFPYQETIAQRRTAERLENTDHKLRINSLSNNIEQN